MALNIVKGVRKPPRIVIYGEPKVGKSTFAANTPKPVFVPMADAGIDNLPVDALPVAKSWAEALANIKQVATEKHDYQTMVVDTLGGLTDLAADFVCKAKFKGDFGPNGFLAFAQGWSATSEEMRQLIPLFDQCTERGMSVLLTAHTGVTTVRNPVDADYSKFCPALDRRVWARFAAWADIILRADFEYSVVDVNKKSNKGRVIGTTTRILRCSGTPAEDAGCRAGYELPDSLPLSWDALAEALGRDGETLPEVQKRWGLFTAEQQRKAMAWLGVKDMKEAPVGKMRQLLNRLRTIETGKNEKKETTDGN
ncbi:MAG: ATP-binding protein [Lentisphaeria bacterium]